VRLYYPDRRVEHGERLPGSGPVIFVLNHPNGLLDPLVLAVTVGRPVRFLAKSTLFANPLGRLAMRAFGWRAGLPRAGRRDVRSRRRQRGHLRPLSCPPGARRGPGPVPRGVSHSDPQLQAAQDRRRSHRAVHRARAGWGPRPAGRAVGLAYEAKTIFRSPVLLVVASHRVADRLGRPATDKPRPTRSATATSTRRRTGSPTRSALRSTRWCCRPRAATLLEGVARVAAWTAASPPDPGEQNRRAHELLDAYHTLSARAPEQVEPIRARRPRLRPGATPPGRARPVGAELEPVRPPSPWAAAGPPAPRRPGGAGRCPARLRFPIAWPGAWRGG